MKATPARIKPSPATQLRTAVFGGSRAKRLLALTTVLGLMAWGTSVAHATNVLFNPDLDQIGFTTQINQCPLGWIVLASRSIDYPPPGGGYMDGGDSEPWCNVSPPSDPNGYGFFFKPFQGSLGPPDNLLDVYLYQDNPATPGTSFTLSGYPSAQANYCGYFTTNSPAPATLFVIEFLDNTGAIIQSNAFDLIAAGMPNNGPLSSPTFQYTTPSVTAPAGTVTVRAGATMLNAYGTSGSQSWFVDSFDLESTAAPGSPTITSQPTQTTVAPGGNATLTVSASGATGYQWQLNGINLSDVPGHISGSTGQALTITGATNSDIGHYRALVSNPVGSVYSADAPLALETLSFYPVITLAGKIGDTYRVDYSTAIAPTTWIPLSTNKLTMSPQLLIDTTSPMNNTKFYRAVFLY
jgi:Immunoglobulin domain